MPRPALALLALAASCLTTAAPAGAAADRSRTDHYERTVIALINGFRAEHGQPPLHPFQDLARSADAHSRDMLVRDFFAHESSNGRSFGERVRRHVHAARLGEVLAKAERLRGRPEPALIVDAWKASPGHTQQLLSPEFERIGLACRTGRLGSQKAFVCTADLASRW